jgi:hypothetical protein
MWLAGKVMPSIVHKRMNWLYGFDVTKTKNGSSGNLATAGLSV